MRISSACRWESRPPTTSSPTSIKHLRRGDILQPGELYWSLVEPFWEEINIYDGPKVFLKTFAAAPREIGLLFAAHFCQSEVRNGGFEQLFFNDTGVLAPEAVEGFIAIGQPRVAKLVETAMEMFGRPYPREREPRQETLETLPDETFEDLENAFFDLIETEAKGFEAAADRYAKLLKK